MEVPIETFPELLKVRVDFPISAFPELETGIRKQSELGLFTRRSVLLDQAITGYSIVMIRTCLKLYSLDSGSTLWPESILFGTEKVHFLKIARGNPKVSVLAPENSNRHFRIPPSNTCSA